MIQSLQNDSIAKISSVVGSGGGRGGGHGSNRGSKIPVESDVQATMSVINNKYFYESERGYVPMVDYNMISKAQKQSIYCLSY